MLITYTSSCLTSIFYLILVIEFLYHIYRIWHNQVGDLQAGKSVQERRVFYRLILHFLCQQISVK